MLHKAVSFVQNRLSFLQPHLGFLYQLSIAGLFLSSLIENLI